jgi:hypothetical protein
MDMLDWAKNEVKIACEKEHPGLKKGEWDYGCACYQSALKAYKSLDEDGHSGFSWAMTGYILKRLMDNKPLTPIEDTDDIWKDMYKQRYANHTVMQCLRMPSLFKYIYDDGRIEYYDNDQFIGIDIHSGISYSLGLIRDVMQKEFPITFPYMPGNTIKVYCEDFLAEPGNGDFDTVGIMYYQTDDGIKDVKRYFKGLSNNTRHLSDNGWREISFSEYMNRKEMADKLKESKDEQ